MKTNGSEHAFPHMHWEPNTGIKLEGGLTKREYFAALAMQGILSNTNHKYKPHEFKKESVICADALIEELNKETKKDET